MNNKEDASNSSKYENIAVNRDDVPSFDFKIKPVFCDKSVHAGAWSFYHDSTIELFCDKCGGSCMHDGVNYVGIEVDVAQLPKALVDKIDKPKFSLCYPCWINGMLK